MGKTILVAVILALVLGMAYYYRDLFVRKAFSPTKSSLQEGVVMADKNANDIEIIATNLDIPWEIAFLPDNSMLVTERPGTIKHITKDSISIPVSGVVHEGEGGLLGIALHPNFAKNNYLYLYKTTSYANGVQNRVERYIYKDNELTDRTVILDNIPGATYHDGGRMEFGPDGKLYITTGDAGVSNWAQNQSSLAGKILRINDDGSFPSDNPFQTAVWSFGHRNPQGIAWSSDGRMWATEHGRSGARTGYDELNLIIRGNNYGWPTIQGDQIRNGMTEPWIHSGPSETWAPAGLAFVNNKLFFAGLRGEALYEYDIASGELESNFFEEYGRLRAVVVGPDGWLYVSTSNTDGRGDVNNGDDKIIRFNPEIFN